jgi:hypothetical protein
MYSTSRLHMFCSSYRVVAAATAPAAAAAACCIHLLSNRLFSTAAWDQSSVQKHLAAQAHRQPTSYRQPSTACRALHQYCSSQSGGDLLQAQRSI